MMCLRRCSLWRMIFYMKLSNVWTWTLIIVFTLTGCSANKSTEGTPSPEGSAQVQPVSNSTQQGSAETDRSVVEELIGYYEKQLINAINHHDFSLVEQVLVPGSNLYIAQKKLVEDLYSKKIKEELVSYQIEKITPGDSKDEFYAFVSEEIKILAEGKAPVSKPFLWRYSVVVSPDRKGLADIKEWEKEDQANPSPSAAAKGAYPYTSAEKAAIDYILGLDDVKAILKDPKYEVQIEESGEFYSLTINEGIISILQFKIRKGDGEIMRWYPEVRSFLIVSRHDAERDSIELQLSSSPTPSPTSSFTIM